MKLLDSRKIPVYMNEMYHRWAKEIVGEKPVGDYYVFSDGGRFRGVTLKGNNQAETYGGIISVRPSDYHVAKVREVKYFSYHFNQLSYRWQEEVAYLFRGKNKKEPWLEGEKKRFMQHLHKSNLCVVFDFSSAPCYISGGETGSISLIDGTVHTKPFPVEETLPLDYRECFSDLLYDFSCWEEKNVKYVRDNFYRNVKAARAGNTDVVLGIGGHLLMTFPLEEETDLPKDLNAEHYVYHGFRHDPVMILSKEDLAKHSDLELYERFMEYIHSVGYKGLFHVQHVNVDSNTLTDETTK